MSRTFIAAKPLQALKLGAVLGSIAFTIGGVSGVLPGRELDALLFVAFSPVILAAVVVGEAFVAGFRLARDADPIARLTARPEYTVVRALEVVVAVVAPATFFVAIVQIGGEVAGPGAIGLLLYGIALGVFAFGAVLVRTLVEYYEHRSDRSSSRPTERRSDPSE